MKMIKESPLGRDSVRRSRGMWLDRTPTGATRWRDRPPLDKRGLEGGFESPFTHPGATVKASQAFTPSDGGDF